jgi:adenine-specific DNA-methyltransferase
MVLHDVPAFQLLKELLKPDGVIFVSIDDNEVHHLRMLMNEIFVAGNMIATLVWEKGRKNDAKLFSVGHEYMLVYARSKELLKQLKTVWRESRPGANEMWQEYLKLRQEKGKGDEVVEDALKAWHKSLPPRHPSKKLQRFLHVDKFGPWRDRDISWPGGGGPTYELLHPVTNKPCAIPERGWGFATFEEMQRQIALGLVVFREDDTKPPFRKAHLHPVAEELIDDDTAVYEESEEEGDDVGMQVMPSVIYKQAQTSVRYLRELLGAKVFENPKDHEILTRLIRYCTGPDDLVLDSFAGSGSAGQAVLQANKEDGGRRRFILVQQEYDSKDDEKKAFNICENVTAVRVKKSSKQESLVGSFTYARLGPRLFGEYRDFGDKPPAFAELAKYIFYTETSQEFNAKAMDKKTSRIGEHAGTAYYLLYKPDDKTGVALEMVWLNEVAANEKCKKLVVYCEKLWAHRDELLVWEKQAGKSLRPMMVPGGLK